MTTKWALQLLNKHQEGKGRGSKLLDDLDLVAKELRTTKANLLKNLDNQTILIQMKKLKTGCINSTRKLHTSFLSSSQPNNWWRKMSRRTCFW
jgi:hypothetical protein